MASEKGHNTRETEDQKEEMAEDGQYRLQYITWSEYIITATYQPLLLQNWR